MMAMHAHAGALKTAQLALKNRINKNQRQRCIVFVGSPISHSKDELERIGKLFKKNNISVDIINYGTENSVNENVEKLETLVQAANTADTSHLINIPPGYVNTYIYMHISVEGNCCLVSRHVVL
jgi:26S proteasome regulatory subunit N10